MVPAQDESSAQDAESLHVTVNNIGGIERCELDLTPGITAFEGRNATNRTSFLSALAGGLGGSTARLKTDADRGAVELELSGSTHRREYIKEGGHTQIEGHPYTADADLVDTFAALLWDNPIRRAVRSDDDLRDLLMTPVDTADVQRRIRERKRERNELRSQLEELERERERLPGLKQRHSEKQQELEKIEKELEKARERVEKIDIDRSEASETQKILDTLDKKRQRQRDLRERRDHHSERIEELRNSIADLKRELAEFETPTEEISRLESKVSQLEDQKRTISNHIDDLLTIISFNDDMLDSDPDELLGVKPDTEAVTDKLTIENDHIICWTCGTEADLEQVENRLDRLRDAVQERRQRREELQSRIDEMQEELDNYKTRIKQKEDLESEFEDLRNELDHREQQRADLNSDLDAIQEEIDSLENKAAAIDDEQADDLIEAYESISDLEYRRGQVQQTVSDTYDEIAELEEASTETEQLESQIDELSEDLDSLRGRIEKIESDVVEKFNSSIEDLLDRLEYNNITRVWLERKISSDNASGGSFELHIVRESDAGNVYEDSLNTLSESERELVGLVLALSGHIVHNVGDEVPVMLLDSVESLDPGRLATLLDYFNDHVDFTLIAVLPEYASALSGAEVISADAL